jgi:hypothetical protein
MPHEKMINHGGRYPKKASSSKQKGTPQAKTKSTGKPSGKRPSRQY